MSVYATNEYIISSNNSINDNKYNTQKAASKSHKIKSILKPLLKMLKMNNKKKSVQQEREFCDYCTECDDNSSNEELEASLFEELEDCQPNSAILVCNDGQWNVTPVHKGQTYVPVHFARTEAGTFFWTSVTKEVDADLLSSRHCYTECQDAAEQMPIHFGQDRWVQA